MIPAIVNGPIYLTSSLSPALSQLPESASVALSGWCEASTDNSLAAKPPSSNALTALRKCSRSGNEATASRITGNEAGALIGISVVVSACLMLTSKSRYPPRNRRRRQSADVPRTSPRPRSAAHRGADRGAAVARGADPGHGAIPGDQARPSGVPLVFPAGRFFRIIF